MAMNAASRFLGVGRLVSLRCVHSTASCKGKPMPDPYAFNVGYEKIRLEAQKVGEDPFESEDRDKPLEVAGTGTRVDPFLIPSRNKERLVCRSLGIDPSPPFYFWVTEKDGGRCPQTGQHFKLQILEGDKWGIDELDLFAH